MGSNSKLEETIDKILTQSESEILTNLKQSFDESAEKLSKSQASLEEEFDRILDEGKKEAEKIAKQIVGSSDLESRNKQLLLVQENIEKVFEKAIETPIDACRSSSGLSSSPLDWSFSSSPSSWK